MGIKYEQFLDRVISLGIEAVTISYPEDPAKLRGAIAGFEACRGRSLGDFGPLLEHATKRRREASARTTAGEMFMEEYFEARCYEAEIEWVANCVSVLLACARLPVIVPPTVNAAKLVHRILEEK